jgi:uncharacterized membrane protein
MSLARILKHLFIPSWLAHRAFPAETLRKIEQAIKASERSHLGELRFVVEAALPLRYPGRKRSSRRRAEELFSLLKVWDTEHNTGVLVYVQLLSRHIDIVADRGIARRVPQHEWDGVCRAMERAFRAGAYEQGALEAIAAVTRILAREFPAAGAHPNELPDKPVVL